MERIVSTHPKATLQDIYKSCFQDRFGVAHALSNRAAVEQFIIRETEAAEAFEEQYAEVCGWRGNFVRINLKAVKEGKISVTELAEAFVASVVTITEEDLAAWKTEWQSIERTVRELYPALSNLNDDSAAIASLLESGQYAMHHSKIYNQSYHPHYRIVSFEEFDKLRSKLK